MKETVEYLYGDEDFELDDAEFISKEAILELPITPYCTKKLKEQISSRRAVALRKKAKTIIKRVSRIDSVSAIGVRSTRLIEQQPLEGIIHDICVIGNIDNKSFNKVILIRDTVSDEHELPIVPFNENSENQAFEIVWRRNK